LDHGISLVTVSRDVQDTLKNANQPCSTSLVSMEAAENKDKVTVAT
jgi:hypothetical protein